MFSRKRKKNRERQQPVVESATAGPGELREVKPPPPLPVRTDSPPNL